MSGQRADLPSPRNEECSLVSYSNNGLGLGLKRGRILSWIGSNEKRGFQEEQDT